MPSVSLHCHVGAALLVLMLPDPLLFSQIQTVTAPQGVSQAATQERWRCPTCGKANTGFRETCGSCNRSNPIAPASKETERKVGMSLCCGLMPWLSSCMAMLYSAVMPKHYCLHQFVLQDIMKCTPDEILALAIQKMHPSLDSAFREAGMAVEQSSALNGNNLTITGIWPHIASFTGCRRSISQQLMSQCTFDIGCLCNISAVLCCWSGVNALLLTRTLASFGSCFQV